MNKTTAVLITIVAIVAIGYFYIEGNPLASSSSSLEAQPASDDVSGRVLSLLQQIKSLHINTKLFKDQGYQTLRDYSVVIPTQDVGRSNPFAPLPGVSTAGTASAGNAASGASH